MSPNGRRAWIGAGIVLGVVLGVQSVRKGLRPQGYDLTAYLDAGAAALAGTTPYGFAGITFPYLYSPFFACAMAPFDWLPAIVSMLLWYGLSVAALAYALRRAYVWAEQAELPRRGRVIAFVVLAAVLFRLVHTNVTNGQVNLILLAMCVAAFESDRRRHAGRAGFWLALAIHTKALPAVLLGYLLVRRRWRTLGWCFAFGCAFALLPFLFWGSAAVDIYADYLHQLETKVREGTIDNGALTIASDGNIEYFTLRGFVATLWPSLSSSTFVQYASVAAIGLTLAVAERARRRTTAADGAAFALYLAAALLVSPLSEKHHLALLIPALALAAFARRHDAVTLVCSGVAALSLILAKPWPGGPWYFLAICSASLAAWRSCRLAPLQMLPRRQSTPLLTTTPAGLAPGAVDHACR